MRINILNAILLVLAVVQAPPATAADEDPASELIARLDANSRTSEASDLGFTGEAASEDEGHTGVAFARSRYGVISHLFAPLTAFALAPSDGESDGLLRSIVTQTSALVPIEIELEMPDVRETSGVVIVEQQQFANGLSVFGARIRWLISNFRNMVEVSSSLLPAVNIPTECVPSRSAADAVETIADRLSPAAIELLAWPLVGAEFGVIPPHLLFPNAPPSVGSCGWRVQLPDVNGGLLLAWLDDTTGELNVRDASMRDAPTEIWYANLDNNSANDTYLCGSGACASYSGWPGGTTTQLTNTYATEFSEWLDVRFGLEGWDNGDITGQMTARADDFGPSSDGAVFDVTLQSVRVGTNSVCRDAIGHEFTHGMVTREIGAVALDALWIADGVGDGLGELFELDETSAVDWLHGTGGTCSYKRDLQNPGSYTAYGGEPFPDSYWMREWSVQNAHHFNATIIGKLAWMLGRGDETDYIDYHWGVAYRPIGSTNAAWALRIGITGMGDDDTFDVITTRMLAGFGSGTIKTNLQNAVMAAGAWTLESLLGISSDSAVDVETFTRNGATVRYAFYNITTSNNAVYRYRTCALNSLSCGWVPPVTIGGTYAANGAPSAAKFNGKLHIAYLGTFFGSPAILYQNLDASGNLGGLTLIAGSDKNPVVVSFNNKLYVFYMEPGAGSQAISYRTLDTAGNWSAGTSTGFSSNLEPAVTATLDGKLWMFYRSAGGYLRFTTLSTAGSWTAWQYVPNIPPYQGSEVPYFYVDADISGLVAANGRLYLTWHGLGREYIISYGPAAHAPYDGWTRAQEDYYDAAGPYRQHSIITMSEDETASRVYRLFRSSSSNDITYKNRYGY